MNDEMTLTEYGGTPETGRNRKKQILGGIVLITLLITVALGTYLIQVKQIFKSRASSGPFHITQKTDNGTQKPVTCEGNTCQIQSLEVEISINELEQLLGE